MPRSLKIVAAPRETLYLRITGGLLDLAGVVLVVQGLLRFAHGRTLTNVFEAFAGALLLALAAAYRHLSMLQDRATQHEARLAELERQDR